MPSVSHVPHMSEVPRVLISILLPLLVLRAFLSPMPEVTLMTQSVVAFLSRPVLQ